MTGKAKTEAKEKAAKAPARAKKTPPVTEDTAKKSPAQCVFDLYNLKFGMTRKEAEDVFDFSEAGELNRDAVLRLGADMVELFFDNLDRLWQVKAFYTIHDEAEAEALLERMSKDYRFQTSTSRVAFEVHENESGGTATLYIRYTEINLKRMYLHHMMALGAVKIAEAEEMARAIKEKEEEEYIPTGPLMF
ncbi:MAG: hypothetical protein HZA22_01260 [Nitrospirae bacterium]|nr:hypothetical protein [Nitrospirota bacterium]MBI5696394.1 hypothetical protein [Nitrospirota bacterium]